MGADPREYAVGDVVWHARCGQARVDKQCPVCFGKLVVTLVLGNGEAVETPCDFCRRGYEGPYGVVHEYEYVADPKAVVVDAIRIEDGGNGRRVHYSLHDHYGAEPEDVFGDEAACRVRCEERRAEHEAEQAKRLAWSKESDRKSYSWHVGYHLREAKSHRKQAEYHEARAVACKALVREEKAKVAAE